MSMWKVVLVVFVAGSRAQQDSPLYQAALLAGQPDNSSECHRHLAQLRVAVDDRRLWALNLLDSSGEPGQGFLWGNGHWLGSYTQCLAADRFRPPQVTTSRFYNSTTTAHDKPPFAVHYLAASATHQSPLQLHVNMPGEELVTIGLCAPRACSPLQVAELLDRVFLSRSLQLQRLLDLDLQLQEVRGLECDPAAIYETTFIVVASSVGLVALLVVAGTLYDTLLRQPRRKARSRDAQVGVHVISVNVKDPQIKLDQQSNKDPSKQAEDDEPTKQGCTGRFLQCFSVYSNTGLVLGTQLGADSIGAVHGLRFLSMVWIIMVHTIYYGHDFFDNRPQAFFISEGFMVQIISNAALSVDSFFFLSGFLVSYLYYKKKAGQQSEREAAGFKAGMCDFMVIVMRRFMRLTPAYMAVLGLTTVNMAYHARTEPYRPTERPDLVCPQYWWRNLLYINNLFSRDQMCMSWSWYLSNDMQFFVLGSFLLILSSSCFVLSAVLLGVVFFTSSLATGVVSYSNGFLPTLDRQVQVLDILYDPPWTRVGPYLVGMVTGYIVVRLDGRLPLSKCTRALCWAAACACNLATLFGLYERDVSTTVAAVYVALSRPAWGLGLSWLIIACCTGNAGFVDKLLSFPGWIPLSRLTYCAYLLNPVLMYTVYMSSERALHFDIVPLCSSFLGHLMMTYGCAYVVSLFFETPVILLMRNFIEKPRRRNASR